MNGVALPPSVLLLQMVFFSIFLVLPLGTWLLFAGRHDDKTRLWFTGISLLSAGMLMIAVRPYLPVYMGHQIPWVMTLASWLAMIEACRRERSHQSRGWLWVALLLVLWSLYQTWVYFKGWTEGLGLASHASMMVVACSVMWWHLFQLNKYQSSKSLVLMILALSLYIIPNLVRLGAFIRTGNEEVMNVFKFSWQANLLSVSYIFAMMSMCFGYWGFTLEKSERERKQAEAGEGVALESAEHFRQLVQERDHLLVMNSRFSAVSSLSSFSAMLIHDISQPLQTLQLGLERLNSRVDKGASLGDIRVDLKHLEQASERAGNLVTSLRHLMRSGESQTVKVAVKPLFLSIKNILDSEMLQKKATIQIECNLSSDFAMFCEPTMFQRIVINLVSNSLNQFENNSVDAPTVNIRLQAENKNDVAGVMVQVSDNGGGFPQELLARLGQPWSSKSQDGMGLALVLSKQLVSQWGGSFELSNRSDGVSGAIVKVWLRQAL